MNVGDQREQAGHLLAAFQNAEFTGGLDFADVVGWSGGDADDFALEAWACRMNDDTSAAAKGRRTEPNTLPRFLAMTEDASFSREWPKAKSSVRKNQLSPPRLTTSCAVPVASARVSNTHWMA